MVGCLDIGMLCCWDGGKNGNGGMVEYLGVGVWYAGMLGVEGSNGGMLGCFDVGMLGCWDGGKKQWWDISGCLSSGTARGGQGTRTEKLTKSFFYFI